MIRITAGKLKGRTVVAPSDKGTRPTQARLREALFNSIQFRVDGARVLDLFAGSGSLGYEALSRGATDVVFVEQARLAVRALEKNAKDLGVQDAIQILESPVLRAWNQVTALGPFDLVFADPPYDGGWAEKLLSEGPWEKVLVPSGLILLESRAQKADPLPEKAGCLLRVRDKRYGDTLLSTYERQADA